MLYLIDKEVPIKLDVWDKSDDPDSGVEEVIATEIITLEKQTEVPA